MKLLKAIGIILFTFIIVIPVYSTLGLIGLLVLLAMLALVYSDNSDD